MVYDQATYLSTSSDKVALMSITVDLDVDTDRDDDIDEDDELDEDTFSTGPEGRGAIVLPNADKDNTTTDAPDNWFHNDLDASGTIEIAESDFNLDGMADDPNREIDNEEDLKDLAPLWIPALRGNKLPNSLVVRLSVSKPAGESAFFADIPPENRVRIFMPTKTEGLNRVLEDDGDSVIGPEAGDYIEFSNTTLDTDTMKSYGKLGGSGRLEFGVEGDRNRRRSRHHAGSLRRRHAARIRHGANESGAVCPGG